MSDQFIFEGEDLGAELNKVRKMFKWSNKSNCYVLCDQKVAVDLVEATIRNTKAYFLGEYKTIFKDYDPNMDTVTDYYLESGYIVRYRNSEEEAKPIKPGTYKFDMVSGLGFILEPIEFNTDAYVPLKIGVKGLEDDVSEFFANKKVYDDLDMRYRRAALIYGPPGNGKSFSIMRTAKELVETDDCVVIMMDGTNRGAMHGTHTAGQALLGHKLLIIMEEVTDSIKTDTSAFLNFLDGEMSWTNCYTIATTNYPETLPPNVCDRPGRFDFLFEVDNPGEEDRRAFLSKFMDVTDKTIRATDTFSISYLREVILRAKLRGVDPEVIIDDLRDVKKKVSRRFKGDPGGQYV